MMRRNHLQIILAALIISAAACKPVAKTGTEDWQSLFNGKDLSGWDIKILKRPLNENYNNTFIVEDSVLRIKYDGYQKFDDHFGHLYYQTPFSYYKLQLQYRFVGKHMADAPGYADCNSGIMLHSQSAKSLELNQTFPVSLEMQFLCSNGKDAPTTGNLCTPGTQVRMSDAIRPEHCINAASKTYNKDVWVNAAVEVYGDSLIRHIIEGDTVLVYTKPTIGGGFVGGNYNWSMAHITDSLPWINKAGSRLTEGYIALQAESQPIDFKNLKLLDLVGCMDTKASNYKSYFIKADNSKCRY
ncbi:MAG: DUF1080 domain-containing protein [Bacteroidota bacterium]